MTTNATQEAQHRRTMHKMLELGTTIVGSWDSTNTRVREPTEDIIRLHLQTLAFIRSSHCSLPIQNLSSVASSSRRERGSASQERTNRDRRQASDRILALEPQMSGLRCHVRQVLTHCQMLAQAAYSIEDELNSYESRMAGLKAQSSRDNNRRHPSPMSPKQSSDSGSEDAGTDAHDGADSDGRHEATTPGLEDPTDASGRDYFGDWTPAVTQGSQLHRTRSTKKRSYDDLDKEMLPPAGFDLGDSLAPPLGLLRAQSAVSRRGSEQSARHIKSIASAKRQRCSLQPMVRSATCPQSLT